MVEEDWKEAQVALELASLLPSLNFGKRLSSGFQTKVPTYLA